MQPLQPHKSEYWLFPKIDNWDKFVARVKKICDVIVSSINKEDANVQVISVDEKTGIQAIERKEENAPKSKGGHLRREYEYQRHGTTTLICSINVENGKSVHHHLGKTRTEVDFSNFMKATVNKLPELDNIIVLSDQLNTHVSESLVRWIGEEEEYSEEELGIKGKKGILKNMKTRKAFLENENHRIQFLFTPKHCSWLNPIENWFAKIQRHVIKNGNFLSVHELEAKLEKYIDFYNNILSKPLNWNFKGFDKDKILFNKTVS